MVDQITAWWCSFLRFSCTVQKGSFWHRQCCSGGLCLEHSAPCPIDLLCRPGARCASARPPVVQAHTPAVQAHTTGCASARLPAVQARTPAVQAHTTGCASAISSALFLTCSPAQGSTSMRTCCGSALTHALMPATIQARMCVPLHAVHAMSMSRTQRAGTLCTAPPQAARAATPSQAPQAAHGGHREQCRCAGLLGPNAAKAPCALCIVYIPISQVNGGLACHPFW